MSSSEAQPKTLTVVTSNSDAGLVAHEDHSEVSAESKWEVVFSELAKVAPSSERELAGATLTILSLIVVNQSYYVQLESEIERYCAERVLAPAALREMRYLYYWARAAQSGQIQAVNVRGYSQDDVIGSLCELAYCCARRERALHDLLGLDRVSELSNQFLLRDLFSGVHRHGYQGVLISGVACLLHLNREAVWAELRIKQGSEYIHCRQGWQAWSGCTATPVGEEQSLDTDPFLVAVPLSSLESASVLDDIEFFVPFAALSISAGRQRLLFEVRLVTFSGEQLFLDELVRDVVVPEGAELISDVISAPQVAQLWSRDMGAASELKIVNADWNAESRAEYGIGVHLSFCLSLFGYREQPISLQFGVFDDCGQSLLRAVINEDEFSNRFVFSPRKDIECIAGAQVDFSLRGIRVPAERLIVVELIAIAANGRVIAGDRFKAERSQRGETDELSAFNPLWSLKALSS